MHSVDWQLAAEIATVFSSIAFAISAIAVMLQLRQMARERYFSVTAHLFEIWQSAEFQRDQLFLLHELQDRTWESFCAPRRGGRAERALHRVGGYYDRVGNLVRHNLIRKQEILPTIGGNAVAVWWRIEPLVKELRLRENAVLFENYEWLLPECQECYVPAFRQPQLNAAVPTINGEASPRPNEKIESTASRMNGDSPPSDNLPLARTRSVTPVYSAATTDDGRVIPDFLLPDSDGVTHRLSEFTATGLAVLIYARGSWCPFCLRQLSDYAERFNDFKRSGIELVALLPESQRKARRLRGGLRLPFTVLSDAKFEAGTALGLEMDERYGGPTAATVMLDATRRVQLSTLNQVKAGHPPRDLSLLARDVLEFGRAVKQGSGPSTPPPSVEEIKPGFLWIRALTNMARGHVGR
jgi:peroxiredoxin Q/BCP